MVDLQQIRYSCSDMKKKKGVQKKVSPEDKFMIEGVQAATNSSMITIEYFLVINLVYDGCTCCANLPDAKMKFSIIPLVNPMCVGF